jgi:3-(3-hydroxy-phenyl)propionate hydroxylase
VQVVIVGAGPVGLFAANILGQNGIDTLVLERNAALLDIPRAILLDDESFRTLQAIGLDREFGPKTRPGAGARYYGEDGVPFAEVGPGPNDYGFPKRSHFWQPELEQDLLDGLARFSNVRVLFSHTLRDMEQDGEKVCLDVAQADESIQRIEASFVLGCDGARSHIRKKMGIAMEGEVYPEDWVIFDVKNDPDQEPVSKFYCSTERPYVSVVAPHGGRRYEFRARPQDTPDSLHDLGKAQELLGAIRPNVPRDDILRAAVYRFEAKNAERYQCGRVFLMGDAAHLTPPFAGQGMNAGVRDAHNLAWKICAVIQGHAGAKLLETYESERRPAAWAMVQLAVAMGDIIMPESSTNIEFRRHILRWMDRFPETREYITSMKFKPPPAYACGAFANLNEQSFVGSLVGSMLPQPPVEWTDAAHEAQPRLDDVIGMGFALIAQQEAAVRAMVDLRSQLWPDLAPTCIALGDGLSANIAGIRTLRPDRSHEHVTRPMAAIRAHRDQIILVRPDRYVAAAFFPEDCDGIQRAVSAFQLCLGNV